MNIQRIRSLIVVAVVFAACAIGFNSVALFAAILDLLGR